MLLSKANHVFSLYLQLFSATLLKMKGKGMTWCTMGALAIGAGVYYYTQRNAKSAKSMIGEAAKDAKAGVNTVAAATNVAVDTAAAGATVVADTAGKAIPK